MVETISKIVKWSALYYPQELRNFLQEIKYLNIKETQIETDFQQTTVTGDKGHSSSTPLDRQFILIPDEAIIEKDRTITFNKTKTFDLSNFPQILKFIEIQCSYIYDFVQEQNINSVGICISKNFRYSNDLDSVSNKIDDFALIKNWLELDINHNEIQPFVFGALVQNFYQQDSKPFIINTTSALSRIKTNIQHVNTLFNTNINLLKTYKIKPEIDTCFKDGRKFEFLNNQIFQTHNFGTYEQNIDIKFISYINCADLREKALNAQPKPETVEFGESYPKNMIGRTY